MSKIRRNRDDTDNFGLALRKVTRANFLYGCLRSEHHRNREEPRELNSEHQYGGAHLYCVAVVGFAELN